LTINVIEGTSAAIFDTTYDQNVRNKAKVQAEICERESMRVRRALDRSNKLTSGPALKKGCVGLHHDIFHEHLY
jgi:hypothetical protein